MNTRNEYKVDVMMRNPARILAAALACGVVTLVAHSANADLIGFSAITDNNSGEGPSIAGQFSIDVVAGANNTHSFVVSNAGPVNSTITQVYIDTGSGPAYLGTLSVTNGAGTDFALPNGGVGPPQLPSQNTATPIFTSDASLKRNSGPGNVANGIDPLENVVWQILFDDTFDAHAALHSGDLRFGIHVQRIGVSDGSDSFVTVPSGSPGPGPGPGPGPNVVPEPASIAMWILIAAVLVAGYWTTRSKRTAI